MVSFGGTDLGRLLESVGQGVTNLLGAFRTETDNPALAGLGGQQAGPDLWAGLDYGGGQNPTAFTPPTRDPLGGFAVQARDPFAALQFGGGPDLWAGLDYGGGAMFGYQPTQGPDLFAGFQQAKAQADYAHEQEAQKQAALAAIQGGAGGTASGGGYDNERDKFEQYRGYIQQYAAANGIDPDALAAILWIETDGNPGDVSPAGARGLGQIMPGTWAGLADPGDDPFNAEHSIKNAAKYYASLYHQFGSYALAAAAYQGGPGAIVNGQARNDIDDGNLTPLGYSQAWQANYDRIKQSAPARAAGNAPVSAQGAAFPVVGWKGQVQLHWGEDSGASDIMAPAGTAVAAMTNGQVVSAGWSDIGGWNVTIHDPTTGLDFYYAHLQSQPTVAAGQSVRAGQVFGAVGDTGNAKGGPAHLHLGIGYGIQSGTGPRGGSGINFNAVDYLNQVWAAIYGGGQ